MLNKYPLWKYLLVLGVVCLGLLYAAPNLYTPDPALQITGESSAQVIDEATLRRATDALEEAGIDHFGEEIDEDGRNAEGEEEGGDGGGGKQAKGGESKQHNPD